jgi:hypothetical protein
MANSLGLSTNNLQAIGPQALGLGTLGDHKGCAT